MKSQEMDSLLEDLLFYTNQRLIEFAQSDEFNSVLAISFGTEDDTNTVETLQESLLSGGFFNGIEVEVLPSETLQGALGAYAATTNTIYLSQALLESSPQQVTAVLLEEVGHAVDRFLNIEDSPGDEGAIFSALVRGLVIDDRELERLKAEQDEVIINLDSSLVEIEQAKLKVISNNLVANQTGIGSTYVELVENSEEDYIAGSGLILEVGGYVPGNKEADWEGGWIKNDPTQPSEKPNSYPEEFRGDYNISGALEVQIEPEAGEELGQPVSLRLDGISRATYKDFPGYLSGGGGFGEGTKIWNSTVTHVPNNIDTSVNLTTDKGTENLASRTETSANDRPPGEVFSEHWAALSPPDVEKHVFNDLIDLEVPLTIGESFEINVSMEGNTITSANSRSVPFDVGTMDSYDGEFKPYGNVQSSLDLDITAEALACPDTSPLTIEVVGGDFEDTDGDGDCDAEGTIYIGHDDGISRMLRVTDTTAELDEDRLILTGGTVYSEIGGITEPLFTIDGSLEIPFSNPTATISETGNASGQFQLAGLDIDFSSLSLQPNSIRFEGDFELPEDITGNLEEIILDSTDAFVIDSEGVSIGGVDAKVEFPAQNFNLFNLLNVEATDLGIEYIALEDQLRIQGNVTLTPFSKVAANQLEIVGNFTGGNFIQIQDGETDIKGTLAVNNITLPRGWGLDKAQLNIDTINNTLGGETKVIFPFGTGIPPQTGIGLGLDFITPLTLPPEVNRVSAEIDLAPGVAIGTTGAFLQNLSGEVNNIAPSVEELIEYRGGIGFTAGPEVFNAALLDLNLEGSVTSEQIEATGTIKVIEERLANLAGTATLNWEENFLSVNGQLNAIDGAIQGNTKFRTDFDYNITAQAGVSLNVPNIVPFFGGLEFASAKALLEFSNDNNLSNDFIAAWRTLNNPLSSLGFSDELVIGIKQSFDLSSPDFFGAEEVPETSSFTVEEDTDFLVINANWENATANDVPVQVIDEDGNPIEETDFTDNNIAIAEELTNETNKTVIIANPDSGIWDLQILDETGLGEINFFATRDTTAPTINLTAPTSDVNAPGVDIEFEVGNANPDTEISLFYDTDNEGFDGIQFADELTVNGGTGSFTWDAEGVPTGEYFIYGMVMDEVTPPDFSYSEGRVLVTEEADLSITQTANTDEVELGDSRGDKESKVLAV